MKDELGGRTMDLNLLYQLITSEFEWQDGSFDVFLLTDRFGETSIILDYPTDLGRFDEEVESAIRFVTEQTGLYVSLRWET